MAELNRTPNPPGSPSEKLLTENRLERIEDYVRGKLGEGPVTNEELVEVFRFYDEKLQYEISKQNRVLELWANVHTHPGGGDGSTGPVVGLDGSWSEITTTPESLLNPATGVDRTNGLIYMTKGANDDSTWVYDIAANSFTELAPLLTVATNDNNWSGVFYEGKFYALSREFEVYDPDTDTWTSLTTNPHYMERCSMYPDPSNGIIWVGPSTNAFSSSNVQTYYYDVVADSWVHSGLMDEAGINLSTSGGRVSLIYPWGGTFRVVPSETDKEQRERIDPDWASLTGTLLGTTTICMGLWFDGFYVYLLGNDNITRRFNPGTFGWEELTIVGPNNGVGDNQKGESIHTSEGLFLIGNGYVNKFS